MTPTGHWTEKKTGCIFTAASFQRRVVILTIRGRCFLKSDTIRRRMSKG